MKRILLSSTVIDGVLSIEFGVYLFGIRIWKIMRAAKMDSRVFDQKELDNEIKQLMK